MIEIKKPTSTGSNTQLITETFNLVGLTNFTTLNSNPYSIRPGIPGKLIVPIIINCVYRSIGTTTGGYYIFSGNFPYNTINALYCWLTNGVVPDQAGTITFENFGTAQFSTGNNEIGAGLQLYAAFDELTANYLQFDLSITYFLI